MAAIKSYTDLKQSKKLAEILPHNTADNTYKRVVIAGCNLDISEEQQYIHDDTPFIFFSGVGVPCWSLAALINLLPSEFTTENEFGKYIYEIKIRKYRLIENVNLYQIAYGNYKFYEDGSSSWKDMINTGEKEELLDAAFEMICWLKENGKI